MHSEVGDGWYLTHFTKQFSFDFLFFFPLSFIRICPGRYFALDSLYTVVTGVLACFTIAPLKDEGRSAPAKMLTGVISYVPKSLFACLPAQVCVSPPG